MTFLKDDSLSWQSLLEALPDGTAILDKKGVMRFVNRLLAELTGYAPEELVDQNVQMLVPPKLRELESIARSEQARDPSTRIIWSDRDLSALRKDGTEISVDFALTPLVIQGHSWAVASIRDNSAQRLAEQARVEAQRHFRMAFEDNMAPMLLTSLEDKIIEANDAFLKMVGRTKDELIGFDSKPFTHPDDVGVTEETHSRMMRGEIDHFRYEKRYLHRDGRTVIAEVSKSPARDEAGNTLYFIVSERDITEAKGLQEKLSYLALHDPLTGLANRALFDNQLKMALSRGTRRSDKIALLLLDLDDFKNINDSHGHPVGDLMLIQVARRLESVTRSSDTLCRFGGDEFLYLTEGISGVEEAASVAERLQKSLEGPFLVAGEVFEQRASLGVVVWSGEEGPDVDLIRDADIALYEAKRLGKGRYVLYVPGMHQPTVNRSSLVQQLRQALPAGELSMHYQPIVDLTTSRVEGFEALMRWRHPVRGWVPPNVFIPLAEQSDLILELGAFALHEAITTASKWPVDGDGSGGPYVTVNLSARQFHDPSLVALVHFELESSGLSADRLVIEITEGIALLEVSDTLSMLDQLRDIGIGFALDDFGTGFSSLSYLARLNPTIVKIDQSFVRPSGDSLHSERLLETIVTMGHNLNMTMLAVGIETPEQLGRLRELKCSLGQGFLFSPSVPAEEANSMVGRSFFA